MKKKITVKFKTKKEGKNPSFKVDVGMGVFTFFWEK
jgi:hypothetical protein